MGIPTEKRIQDVAKKLSLIDKHISLHWFELQEKPREDEIRVFIQELQCAVKELEEIYKILTVFK